jgi:phosphomannomutase
MNNLLDSKKNLFRAYDVRGIFGSEINPEMFFRIGIAVSKVIENDIQRKVKIYVGFDIRQTSQILAYSFITGALSTGAQIIFSDLPKPFGVVMFSGFHEKVDFTAFITASHLPPDWNGIKFYYGDGVGFAEEKIIAIRDYFLENSKNSVIEYVNWKEINLLHVKMHFDKYLNYMKDNFKLTAPLKVIIDCGNGSASLTAPDVFNRCGYNSILHWCTVDSSFPNRSSEPNEESLKVLSQKVVAEQVDFGVGFDGDGDRAVIVDTLGRIIPADEIAILIAKYLKDFFKEQIQSPLLLANIECSSAFETNLSQEFDIKRIKVGHTFLTLEARLNKSSCLLGVESSGHFVFPQYFLFDDAMLLPLIVGKIIEKEKKSLVELLQNLPKMQAVRKTFKSADHIKFIVIEKLTKELKVKYPQLNDIDGLAINFNNNGYVLIRASNTGPKIRLFAEAKTKERVNEIASEFSLILEQKNEELNKILYFNT